MDQYSSDVRLRLLVGSHDFNVAEVAGDSCCLRDPRDVPPGEGTLVIRIDDQETRQAVSLPDGISQREAIVKFVRI